MFSGKNTSIGRRGGGPFAVDCVYLGKRISGPDSNPAIGSQVQLHPGIRLGNFAKNIRLCHVSPTGTGCSCRALRANQGSEEIGLGAGIAVHQPEFIG